MNSLLRALERGDALCSANSSTAVQTIGRPIVECAVLLSLRVGIHTADPPDLPVDAVVVGGPAPPFHIERDRDWQNKSIRARRGCALLSHATRVPDTLTPLVQALPCLSTGTHLAVLFLTFSVLVQGGGGGGI